MSWIRPKNDNLGNHIATKDLDLNNFNIKNVNKIIKEIIGNLNIETCNGNINLIANGHLTGVNIQNKIFTIGHSVSINSPVISLSSDNNKHILNAQDFLEIKHNIIKIDIPSKGENKVLTCIDNNGTCEFRELSNITSENYYQFICSARGQTTGLISHFYKVDVNGNNSNILSLTSPYEQLRNNQLDPFVAPKNIKIVRISGVICHCAVSGSYGDNPKLTFNFYKNTSDNRILKGVVFIPVSNYGIYNNLSNDNYQEFSVDISNLNITFNQGETWGIQFQGYTSPEYIAVIQGCYLNILAKEI